MHRALAQLPNLLGLSRLAAAPAVAWLLLAELAVPAFWVFLIAGLSDAADGTIARRLQAVTVFGALLDPIADKLLVNATYLSAAATGLVPWWMAALVFARDAGIALGAGLARLLGRERMVLPLAVGKLTTGGLIAFAAFALATGAFGWQRGLVYDGLMGIATALMLASAAAYAGAMLRRLRPAAAETGEDSRAK